MALGKIIKTKSIMEYSQNPAGKTGYYLLLGLLATFALCSVSLKVVLQ